MASEHQSDAPSLEFSNESDDDYVSDQGYVTGLRIKLD